MRSGDVKAFLIIVLSLAIVFVLCLIFSEVDKKQSENNAETNIMKKLRFSSRWI